MVSLAALITYENYGKSRLFLKVDRRAQFSEEEHEIHR
jgi:hypothetical protein